MNEDLFDESIKEKIQMIKENNISLEEKIPEVVRLAVDETLNSIPSNKFKKNLLLIIRNSVAAMFIGVVLLIIFKNTSNVFGENKYSTEEIGNSWKSVIEKEIIYDGVKVTFSEILAKDKEMNIKYMIEGLDDLEDDVIKSENIEVLLDGKFIKIKRNDYLVSDGAIIGEVYLKLDDQIEANKNHKVEAKFSKIGEIKGIWDFIFNIEISE